MSICGIMLINCGMIDALKTGKKIVMWNMERIGLWSVFEMSAIKLLLAEKELCVNCSYMKT